MLMRDRLHTRRLNQNGAVLLIVALSSVALLGMVGLASDVGYMYHYRRVMQTAADAGALAGGAEIERGMNNATVQASARTATARHNFADGTAGVQVTVHHPPVSGSYIGNTKFVEVLIERPLPIFLMRIFGFTTMRVPARAVAGIGGNGKACVYVLDPTMEASFQANSSATVNAACGIVIDSNHANAMDLNSSTRITADGIAVTGGYSTESSAVVNPTPSTGVPRAGDPLPEARLPAPSFTIPTTCPTGYHNRKLFNDMVVTLNPGVYCGGIWAEGNSVVTLNPGIYILVGGQDSSFEKGSLHIAGNARVTGAGVMFYITQTATEQSSWGGSNGKYRPVVTESSTRVQLSAYNNGSDPDDPYNGILFFDDRSTPVYWPDGSGKPFVHKLQSSTESYMEGVLYFPNHELALESSVNSTHADFSTIVARRVRLESSTVWNLGQNFSGYSSSPIKRLTLVE